MSPRARRLHGGVQVAALRCCFGGTWRRGQDDKVDSNGVRAGNMTGVDGHHARCLASRRVAGRTTS